jgi:hypothetical protein
VSLNSWEFPVYRTRTPTIPPFCFSAARLLAVQKSVFILVGRPNFGSVVKSFRASLFHLFASMFLPEGVRIEVSLSNS